MEKKIFSLFATIVFILSFSVSTFSQSNSHNGKVKIERYPITAPELSSGSFGQANIEKNSIISNVTDNNRANTTVVVGNNSTSGNGRAPQGTRRFINTKYIITGTEMSASGFAGPIQSVGWRWNVPSPPAATPPTSQSTATTGNLRVYVRDTTGSATSMGVHTFIDTNGVGYTKIIDGTITMPTGLAEINIDVPAGGPGTSVFTPTPGNGVILIFVYKTTTAALPTPLGAPNVFCTNAGAGTMLLTYQSQTVGGSVGGASVFRPETRFGNTLVDAVSVGPIYALGESALCPCPDTNEIITNMFHLRAQLDTVIITTTIKNVIGGGIKGTFIDTIITSAIERWVIFYYADKEGDTKKSDSIISVGVIKGTEDVTGNNRSGVVKRSTLNRWNQANPTGGSAGGVGFNGATGDFVAGFYTSCTIPITAVDLTFNQLAAASQPYNVKIYGMDNDTLKPGALLYTSAAQSTPGGIGISKVTHVVAPGPVMVGPGYYFVGIAQTGTVNIACSYQNESPLRFGVFFFDSPVGSNVWTEFAAASLTFKLDIAPKSYLSLTMGAWLEGFFNGTSKIADTVRVTAHSLTTLLPIETATSVLGTSGTAVLNYKGLNNDSCYIYQVRHRNHIQTWSHLACEKIDECGKMYDFRNNITQAFGNNMVFVNADGAGGGFALFGGDVNQDDIVDGSDCGQVDNDAFNFVTGYVATDLNGDQIVDGSDGSICDNNAFNFVAAVIP